MCIRDRINAGEAESDNKISISLPCIWEAMSKRYLELNKDNIRNLDEQLESLQVQIQQERIKSGRFNSFSITDFFLKPFFG